MQTKINAFDCDGVVTVGIYPGPNDIIITGRSYEEEPETIEYFRKLGITNKVYFNPIKYDEKTRLSSGQHKARTLNALKESGVEIRIFFEDDPIQWEVIEKECPWLNVVHIVHDLTNKENQRHFVESEQ